MKAISADGRHESSWRDVVVSNTAGVEAQRVDLSLDFEVEAVVTKKKEETEEEAAATTNTEEVEEEKSTSPMCQLLPVVCGLTSFWTG